MSWQKCKFDSVIVDVITVLKPSKERVLVSYVEKAFEQQKDFGHTWWIYMLNESTVTYVLQASRQENKSDTIGRYYMKTVESRNEAL
jgi:type IV secretory pathway TrbF-like protein